MLNVTIGVFINIFTEINHTNIEPLYLFCTIHANYTQHNVHNIYFQYGKFFKINKTITTHISRLLSLFFLYRDSTVTITFTKIV